MIPKMELVLKEEKGLKSELYTTSKIIAECAEVKHPTIQRLIRNHTVSLESFGKVGFEIRALESGQKEKIYLLNEQQATLIMTFLKNSPVVVEFKKELVKQFYQMREELYKRNTAYMISTPIQKDLHKAITESPAYRESENLKFMYPNFNRMLLESATGIKVKEIRKRGNTETFKELLTAEELEKLSRHEVITMTMLECGSDYHLIKETLNKNS